MTSCFDEIKPIFQFLCECTEFKPHDRDFLIRVMRASCIILSYPKIVDDLIELGKQYLEIPGTMPDLKQKSQQCLMVIAYQFIEECDHLAHDLMDSNMNKAVDAFIHEPLDTLMGERPTAHLQA